MDDVAGRGAREEGLYDLLGQDLASILQVGLLLITPVENPSITELPRLPIIQMRLDNRICRQSRSHVTRCSVDTEPVDEIPELQTLGRARRKEVAAVRNTDGAIIDQNLDLIAVDHHCALQRLLGSSNEETGAARSRGDDLSVRGTVPIDVFIVFSPNVEPASSLVSDSKACRVTGAQAEGSIVLTNCH